MVKKIAVYGAYTTLETVSVPQRYWKWIYHRKGSKAGQKWYKRRVWKKVKRLKKVIQTDARYELKGSGKDLYKAIRLAHRYMPKGYVDVAAREFLEHPDDYGVEGAWIDRDIVSR